MNGPLLLECIRLLKANFEARANAPEKPHENGGDRTTRKIVYEDAARDLGKLIEAADKS